VGIMFTLVLVARDAGVKFFRFNAGLAAILIGAALVFWPSGPDATTSPTALVAFSIVEVAVVVYWATVGRILASIRPLIVSLAVSAGLVGIVAQALAMAAKAAGGVSAALASAAGAPSGSLPVEALTVASFLSSAMLLGGACTAMILGHWYLVIPSLQVSHLQKIVKVHIASMVVRVAVVAAAVIVALASWPLGPGPSFRHYITSVDGIFFWQRVLFGLAGPAVLSYMTWETAKIRSTQSATGILYVDFFTVVVGEVLAKYLVLATRVPL
ncbi:MAG TPA: hypothetical protein VNZ26_12660, partial [Vicinamibacterales bacterium]|nr:hypothetical protein [Vicinamibacterales bacterium]